MKTSPFRTLIVDDHAGFRQFLRGRLEEQTECQVIDQVCDGLAAVQKAEELHPDLILLDLGLPGLNGMEAGRRIRKVCPKIKILIVSQDSAPEIVEGAFRMGAQGFLLKSDAADLALAVDAVLHDRLFISSHLDGSDRRLGRDSFQI